MAAAAALKKEAHLLDGHKAKTKTRHHKKNKETGDDKRGSTRSSKHKAHAKEKAAAEPKAPSVLPGGCPSCSVQYPNPCSCPAQPGQPPLPSPLKITCSKPKSASADRKSKSKSPRRTAQKRRTKPGHDAQGSRGAPAVPPKSLPVKIDLSFLSRVPQISGNHHGRHHQEEEEQETASKAKRSKDPGGAGSKASATQKPTKTSRKTIPPHVRDRQRGALVMTIKMTH